MIVGLVGLVIALTATPAFADLTYSETTGGVTHTWTNHTNAGGTEGPTIPAYTTVQISCALTGFKVANGNPWWYRIASSPWNNTFFASADAFYNNGQTSGSLRGTPWVDPAVPICGAAPPPPPPPPAAPPTAPPPSRNAEVTLAQGPVAPRGYRYAISLSGFAANARVSISCHDSADPGGFYDFALTTNSAGEASTQSQCYSADGPDHWMLANGIESNHVRWSGSSGGARGQTGGSRTNDGSPSSGRPPTAPAEQCQKPSGDFIANNGRVAYALYDHYMWAKGSAVVIEWSYFSNSDSFVKFAKGLAVDRRDGYRDSYRNAPNTDMFYALGSFWVKRISENCYVIADQYDFRPSLRPRKLPDTIFTLPQWFYQLSGAREFDIHAAGRL